LPPCQAGSEKLACSFQVLVVFHVEPHGEEKALQTEAEREHPGDRREFGGETHLEPQKDKPEKQDTA
jgi:hypothetical protein